MAARKRRFALACCKGSAIQAVACVQIGPRNESVRGFLAQEACMSVCLLNVDPAAPQFKAGAHLCREVRQEAREREKTRRLLVVPWAPAMSEREREREKAFAGHGVGSGDVVMNDAAALWVNSTQRLWLVSENS